MCLDSKKIEEFTELTSPNLVQTGFTIPLVRCSQALGETAPYSKPKKSVSNLFIINHIVRFLTITNVERLKSLKSFFFFFLIFTWKINIVFVWRGWSVFLRRRLWLWLLDFVTNGYMSFYLHLWEENREMVWFLLLSFRGMQHICKNWPNSFHRVGLFFKVW